MPDETFSLQEAMAVQRAMREQLGLPEERFPMPAFVSMLSDEIEQLRDAGRSDEQIAEVIRSVSGKTLDPADIARHYAPPEARQRG